MCNGVAASGGRRQAEQMPRTGRNAVVSLLRLKDIAKNFGAIEALRGIDLEIAPGEVVGPDGRQRRRQVDAGQDHRRQLPARPPARSRWRARSSTSTARSTPAPGGIEVVYQDLALADNLTAARERLPRPRAQEGLLAVPDPRQEGDDRPLGRAVRGAQVRDPAARSRAQDVGRPAPGGGHRPHPAFQGQARADGRADRGHLGAPGGRGAEPDPPHEGAGRRDHADQPPHARRLRGLRPHRRRAPRHQGRRQGDRRQPSPEEITGLITGAIHAA